MEVPECLTSRLPQATRDRDPIATRTHGSSHLASTTASDYVVLQQNYPTAAYSHQMPHRVREPHDPLLTGKSPSGNGRAVADPDLAR
jgi:hypothetical protein